MRRALDLLYKTALGLAACSMVAILVLVSAQMVARLIAVTLPGAQDFAAYGVAAASFLALGPALRAGAHVRVNFLLQHVGRRAAWWLELWCCLIGTVVAAYLAYWSIDLVWDSYQYGEVASTLVSTPLWIPRLSMAFGTVVLLVSLVDDLASLLRNETPHYNRARATNEG